MATHYVGSPGRYRALQATALQSLRPLRARPPAIFWPPASSIATSRRARSAAGTACTIRRTRCRVDAAPVTDAGLEARRPCSDQPAQRGSGQEASPSAPKAPTDGALVCALDAARRDERPSTTTATTCINRQLPRRAGEAAADAHQDLSLPRTHTYRKYEHRATGRHRAPRRLRRRRPS